MNLKNKIFFSIYIVISIFVIILSIELLLYYTSDQSRTAKLYPRYEFLDEIGIIPKKNVIMKHSVRGYSTKTYTINEQRYRGDLISIDDQSKKIIVLGDSHSFGVGVNDHETFSFKLDKLLGDHKVINLSSPGWGLTHQINRYLTIGENHKPEIIIIQFCSNDPSDNKREESIIWDKDKLEFIKIKIGDSQYNSTKILVSKVPFLFDFLSGNSLIFQRVKQIYAKFLIDKEKKIAHDFFANNQTDLSLQQEYIFLLDKFINQLVDENKKIIFIDVASQLKEFNYKIYDYIIEQDKKSRIDYLDISQWITEDLYRDHKLGPRFTHYWGNSSNRWIAMKLSEHIQENYYSQEYDWIQDTIILDLIDKCNKIDC